MLQPLRFEGRLKFFGLVSFVRASKVSPFIAFPSLFTRFALLSLDFFYYETCESQMQHFPLLLY